MPARWFVQTRGSRPDEDYTWCSVAAADPRRADAIVARGYKGRGCFSLLDGERPGVLLFDDDTNGTVLLVTGLLSSGRPVDYQKREIRLSLLGVARDHGPGQRDLVAVAMSALRGELTSDLLVSYGAEGGFSVDRARWSRFVEQAADVLAGLPHAEADPEKIRVVKDTDSARRGAADQLGALYLQVGPDLLADRITILRTSILEAFDIGRLRAWRTISDIEASPRDFASTHPIGVDAIADVAKVGKAAAGKVLGTFLHGRGFIISISAVALAGIAAVVTLAILPGGSPPRPPPPTAPRWGVADVIGSPGGASTLESISAAGPGAAVGVGLTCPPGCPAPGPRPLVMVWNGTAWARLPPVPASASGTPERLAAGASSAADVWVFDTAQTSRGLLSYALHWDGGQWAVTGLAGSPAISAAAVFGPDDAWAFGALPDGRPYDLRYDGRRWAGVTLPAVLSGGPDALAPLSRDDMWAIATTPTTVGEPAARQAHVLLHWDGVSWQPAALPDLRLPAGESGVPSGVAAGGSRDVWVTGYVVAKTAPVGAFLLRWDGTSWHRVGLPGPGLAPGAVAQDGAGGLWLSASLPGGAASLYHYDGRRWTSQQVAAKKGYLTRLRALSLIPGTRSLWASGSLEPASPGAGHQAVILKYGS